MTESKWDKKLRAIWDEMMKDPTVPAHDIMFDFARRAYDPRRTHPEAQGNKDLGEPQTSFAWQKIETAPKDVVIDLWVHRPGYKNDGYRATNCHWDGDEFVDGAGNYINAVKRYGEWTVYPSHWAPLPPPPSERSEAAPTSPQPIKGDKTEALTDAATLQGLEGL